MLRNAIDHGLEGPEERTAAGKPAQGIVRLAALHRGGRIVIEVSDDGRGIKPARRSKGLAVAKGLIDPEAPLSDDEIDNLIFLPGFSTASEVSTFPAAGSAWMWWRSVQRGAGRTDFDQFAARPGLNLHAQPAPDPRRARRDGRDGQSDGAAWSPWRGLV